MSALSPRSFELELARGVARITLDRPERLNALTFEVYRELAETFDALGTEPACRAILLTGKGRGFCSGGDQDAIIAELFARDAAGLLDFTRATGRLIESIATVPRPVVAAVNGVAVGAGAVIAAACDLRVASAEARFGYVFPKVGLCGADMGAAYLLPRIVGRGHAAELLYFGDLIDAKRALEIGLVNRVVKDGAAAVKLAGEWAEALARGPAFAHAMTKKMIEAESTMGLRDALEAEAQAQATCMVHPDFKTAHVAFKEKRAPVFEGAEIVGVAPEKHAKSAKKKKKSKR
ncbi:MAG TPA: enoyl-CoA hydratase family protein [Kofleriaceae bacterium]|nr:enoyl-CoA hydratase family protein [Kofleriaceae bacterium]